MNKFSIILPVRNGGEYVKECVQSILSQTLNNFNLIVLDNNSTDGTREWIIGLNDNRIVLHPSDKPLSIEENWARIVNIPKNEFITLIGHDDILAPDYLQIMEKLIKRYPDASLYQCHFNFIDGEGQKIRECRAMMEKETCEDFLKSILTSSFDITGTGFLMRSEDYDRIGGIPNYPGLLFADYELWLNLTKLKYKATSPQRGFAFRLHKSATTSSADNKYQAAFEKFILYLHHMQKISPSLNSTIEKYGQDFLLMSCRAMSHRLLRTYRSSTSDISVKKMLHKCEDYAQLLIPSKEFAPLKVKSIKIALIIDNDQIGRRLFLLFKKMFPKPLIK